MPRTVTGVDFVSMFERGLAERAMGGLAKHRDRTQLVYLAGIFSLYHQTSAQMFYVNLALVFKSGVRGYRTDSVGLLVFLL